MNPKVLAGLLVAGVLVGALVVGAALREPVDWNGTRLDPPVPAAPFTLASQAGPVSLADLRGRVVVLFFGYTSCPDVCPTTLLRLSRAMEALGAEREDVQVVFVSVDPERDTPVRTDRYARAVDPAFLGLSGAPEAVAEVAGQYGIYFAKAEGSRATGYLVDHSATITVLDRRGRVALLWSPDVEAEGMAADLRALL